MDHPEHVQEAIDLLQQLGLKEYEARCFVGLSRIGTGTAKRLSELTEVPRTRVYDAVRVLEAQGLVEVHHASPQRFRAVPIDEAVDTLRDRYETRVDRLQTALVAVDSVDPDEEKPAQEVWAMSGCEAIENRTCSLVDDASDEVVFVVGDESVLADEVTRSLEAVRDHVDVLIGAPTEELRTRVQSAVPGVTTFVTGLEWLPTGNDGDEETAVGRLLLVDRSRILVSTVSLETGEELAICGSGFANGLVVIARRLVAENLAPRVENPT